MLRTLAIIAAGLAFALPAAAQTTRLSLNNNNFVVTNVFSDVDTFAFDILIDAPLAPGNYVNPDIVSVSYSVSGTLTPGTPSGFAAFALQRDMTGAEFYAQGSSLSFEVGPNAVLADGVQIAELVGAGLVFTFNGKEIGNGRYHPALLELNANGTGRIQNSDNIIVENPLEQVDFGEEYINDLTFDPGNTTLLIAIVVDPPKKRSGSGRISLLLLGVLCLMALVRARP